MPVAKIHVLEGRYDEARLGRVSNAVQQGLPALFEVAEHSVPSTDHGGARACRSSRTGWRRPHRFLKR